LRGKQIEHEQDRKETGKRETGETGKTGKTGKRQERQKEREEKRERDKQEIYIFKFAFDVI
jgi:hypothetical protein